MNKTNKMEYKIKKGDRFLCVEDYIMDNERIAYSKGKEYLSELDNCITDNDLDMQHEMINELDFFEHFKLAQSK